MLQMLQSLTRIYDHTDSGLLIGLPACHGACCAMADVATTLYGCLAFVDLGFVLSP